MQTHTDFPVFFASCLVDFVHGSISVEDGLLHVMEFMALLRRVLDRWYVLYLSIDSSQCLAHLTNTCHKMRHSHCIGVFLSTVTYRTV